MSLENKDGHSNSVNLAVSLCLGGLLALFFLVMGVANLVSPDVPSEALGENTRVCITLILTAAVIVYSFFSPFIGGWILLIWAIPFAAVFHFHPIFGFLAGLIFLIGGASVIRGRRYQKKGF